MSKLAIISDIHANTVALDAVIADAKAHDATSFVCLGDIVGYGPKPSECVTRIQELNCVTVKGNHDLYAGDDFDLTNVNEEAKEAMLWTREKLSDVQKTWLSSLPYVRRLGRNSLVHATLDDPQSWGYVHNRFDASLQLKAQSTLICFCGHSHRPVAYEFDGESTNKLEDEVINIDYNNKYFINVGSVGQPRDGDPRPCYVIFDRTARTVTFRRIEYDIQATVAQIEASRLPNSLAQRLMEAS